MTMRGGLEDTICAIATPTGQGGIGIVRLSGPCALMIAGSLVRLRSKRPFESVVSHSMHLVDVLPPRSMRDPGQSLGQAPASSNRFLDEALVVYMKAPHSFTGEDTVEIQSHGGGLVLSLLCQSCVEAGARLAEPGEFTKRAFLNGRLDLSQAEAVLDTIEARSSASLVVAQRQLRGELADEVSRARGVLLRVLAHVEAGIDFVEEDIAFLRRDDLVAAIKESASVVCRLQATAQQGRIMREGARVVILGRPNVGKSSLLNCLLREDRAIVTAVPGTTRDVIEESIDVEGLRLHLVDTAGIRDTSDPVEQAGINRSRLARMEADLELIVVDGSAALTADDLRVIAEAPSSKHIVVVNKSDLPAALAGTDIKTGSTVCHLSAKTGKGIDELRKEIRSQLVSDGADTADGVVVTNVRHRNALLRASDALDHALASAAGDMAAELVALDVHAAADALGEITGDITTDEILEQIFSEFCIGK